MGKAEPTHTSTLYQAEYGHFINGKWEGSASGEKIGLYNPATGALLSSIQSGNAADAVRAVEAASAAFPRGNRADPSSVRKSCSRWRAECGRASRTMRCWSRSTTASR